MQLTEQEITLVEKCARIKALKLQLEDLKKQLDEAEDFIKEELTNQELSELKVGLFKITYKDCVRTSFDSKSFQEDYAKLYELYTTKTTYKRLMIK